MGVGHVQLEVGAEGQGLGWGHVLPHAPPPGRVVRGDDVVVLLHCYCVALQPRVLQAPASVLGAGKMIKVQPYLKSFDLHEEAVQVEV